jgi:hypothetical protein
MEQESSSPSLGSAWSYLRGWGQGVGHSQEHSGWRVALRYWEKASGNVEWLGNQFGNHLHGGSLRPEEGQSC